MAAGPEKKSHGLWMVAGPLFVCVVAVVASRLNDRVSFKQDALTPSMFTVEAGSLSSFPFNVYKTGRVLGRFQSTGGSGNDIEAVITDARDFENWKDGRLARVLYKSERTSIGRIDILLQPGRYYLAFNNRLSPRTDQTIIASILLDQ